MRPARKFLLFTMGIHFGFPECCINAFVADHCSFTQVLYPEGPWMGTGFMPCACCAESALNFEKFVAERIAPNRMCATPFPYEDESVLAMAHALGDLAPLRLSLADSLMSHLDRIVTTNNPLMVYRRIA